MDRDNADVLMLVLRKTGHNGGNSYSFMRNALYARMNAPGLLFIVHCESFFTVPLKSCAKQKRHCTDLALYCCTPI